MTGQITSKFPSAGSFLSFLRMKALLGFCFSIPLAIAAAASAAPSGSVQAVRIIEGRASEWRIVCPPPASPAINWAAEELQRLTFERKEWEEIIAEGFVRISA